jgi:hypothetical protein
LFDSAERVLEGDPDRAEREVAAREACEPHRGVRARQQRVVVQRVLGVARRLEPPRLAEGALVSGRVRGRAERVLDVVDCAPGHEPAAPVADRGHELRVRAREVAEHEPAEAGLDRVPDRVAVELCVLAARQHERHPQLAQRGEALLRVRPEAAVDRCLQATAGVAAQCRQDPADHERPGGLAA